MQAPDSIGTGDRDADAGGLDPVPVRFVLVEPTHCGNIGASARAIRTMGFGGLSVVAPRDQDYRSSADAVALAAHASAVLQDSRCCAMRRSRPRSGCSRIAARWRSCLVPSAAGW